MIRSPAVVLFDVNSVAMAVAADTAIPANTRGLLFAGTDGTNARILALDSSGNLSSLPLPTGAATQATLATLATESKLESVRALLATIDADTSSLAAEDFATQTTLAALLAAFSAEDFASQTTLAAAKTVLDAIDAVLDSIKDADGIKKITDALPTGDNYIGRAKIGDGTNLLTIADSGDDISAAYAIPIVGKTAADLARMLLVEDDGKLLVASTPPQPPPGTTEFVVAVNESELNVGSGGDVTSPHTTLGSIIGNGLTLALQLITAGAAGDPSERGSVVEVYWREGAGPTDHLIERMYLSGQTLTVGLPDTTKTRDGTTMTGDGSTTRIVVVRERLSTASQEIDFVIRGYTE